MKVKIINYNDKPVLTDYLNKHNLINEYCIWNVKETHHDYYLLDIPVYEYGYWIGKVSCEIVQEEIYLFNNELEKILEI